MRVLITGASGFMGAALARRFGPRADVELFAIGRKDLDLLHRPAITQIGIRE